MAFVDFEQVKSGMQGLLALWRGESEVAPRPQVRILRPNDDPWSEMLYQERARREVSQTVGEARAADELSSLRSALYPDRAA